MISGQEERGLPGDVGNPGRTYQTLRIERSGAICTITLDRPESDNIANAQMLHELPLAWEAFRADDSLRVAIFTAAGDEMFCGGVDSAVFHQDGPPPRLSAAR